VGAMQCHGAPAKNTAVNERRAAVVAAGNHTNILMNGGAALDVPCLLCCGIRLCWVAVWRVGLGSMATLL
jgi:hypothetical protein